MKTMLLLLTLAIILGAVVLSYQDFLKAAYYTSALLTAAWFVSLSLWIHKVSAGKTNIAH